MNVDDMPAYTNEWHNCDGHIGELLQCALSPSDSLNTDGQPCWFIIIIEDEGWAPLVVKYCPVCGAKLSTLIG